jgi:hypothetical protein
MIWPKQRVTWHEAHMPTTLSTNHAHAQPQQHQQAPQPSTVGIRSCMDQTMWRQRLQPYRPTQTTATHSIHQDSVNQEPPIHQHNLQHDASSLPNLQRRAQSRANVVVVTSGATISPVIVHSGCAQCAMWQHRGTTKADAQCASAGLATRRATTPRSTGRHVPPARRSMTSIPTHAISVPKAPSGAAAQTINLNQWFLSMRPSFLHQPSSV